MQSFIIVSKNEEYTLRPMSEFAMIIDSWEVVGSSVAKSCPTLATHRVYLPAPLSLGFSRQEYWSGLPFPSPGDFPDPTIVPRSLAL